MRESHAKCVRLGRSGPICRLTTAFLYSITVTLYIIMVCAVRPFAGGHLEYMKLLKYQSSFENIG